MGASKEQPFTIRDTIRDFMHSGKNDIRNDDCGYHELIADRRGMVLIEAVLPSDIEQIRSLFVEYAESLSFNLCFQSFDEELRDLPAYYSAPNGRLLLAHYLDDPAGCIALRPLQSGICEMKRLYVRPSVRGQGLGKILIQRLIAEARAIGYERMRLDTIQSDMADAIALYRKLGFREIEPYSKIPNESALWMELLL